ncbi:unnamed protein product [Acanthoscelides obtectus]|uniref:Sensory neuron membrane protein 2 n=1 Tax=Acanthoscelides obtectus TaxID=200917 RepID=A0A9P0KGI0_ACAOB|nr:unnamed protein product [Acanthoscelides obtectus]CAK1657629.1 Sensory neuron membrane protein 1 [Acanthoscelides obtectus]
MFQNLNLKLSNKILLVLGGFGLFFAGLGYYFGFVALSDIIDDKIWEMKILKEGTEQWKMFLKIPFPFTLKVHIFNVKNPEAVLQGAKPALEEVGPFIYRVFKWKSEVKWDTPDEISYNDYQTYHFDKEASGRHTEDDIVTVLNTPYLSMLEKIEQIQPSMFEMIEPVLPAVFGENAGPFMQVKVGDYMFKGVKICEHEGGGGMVASMACKELAKKVKSKEARNMRIEGDTILFANLHYKNNSRLGRHTIKSGIQKKQDTGTLIKYNEAPYTKKWKGEASICNKIRGVTTIFPNKIRPDMTFDAFSEDVCRSMTLAFQRPDKVKGVNGLRFAVRNDTFDYSRQENQCFCTNKSKEALPDTGCLKNGICDLSTCTGGPVMLSFPHLLYADPEYIHGVEGLQPNQSKHETFVVLEPLSGFPLQLAQRVQFNMFLRPIEGVTKLQNVTEALVPLLWIEQVGIGLHSKWIESKNTFLSFIY